MERRCQSRRQLPGKGKALGVPEKGLKNWIDTNERKSIGAYAAVAHCNTVDKLETVRMPERE